MKPRTSADHSRQFTSSDVGRSSLVYLQAQNDTQEVDELNTGNPKPRTTADQSGQFTSPGVGRPSPAYLYKAENDIGECDEVRMCCLMPRKLETNRERSMTPGNLRRSYHLHKADYEDKA